MKLWMAIAVGGAIGSLARYGMSGIIQQSNSSAFPWGTLLVNLTGSFLMGCLWHWMEYNGASTALKGLILVGGLGAFTTFSTYSLEVLTLSRMHDLRLALTYVLSSNVLCVLGAVAGYLCLRPFLPTS